MLLLLTTVWAMAKARNWRGAYTPLRVGRTLRYRGELGSQRVWTVVSKLEAGWDLGARSEGGQGLVGCDGCVWWDTKSPFSSTTHTLCLLLAYNTGRTGTYCSYPWYRCQRHKNTQHTHSKQTKTHLQYIALQLNKSICVHLCPCRKLELFKTN